MDFGRGLIKCGSSIVPFVDMFPKNNRIYKLLTTKPSEVSEADNSEDNGSFIPSEDG